MASIGMRGRSRSVNLKGGSGRGLFQGTIQVLIFPDRLKMSAVKPLYKKVTKLDDKLQANFTINYFFLST
jgi:hypothetical protein